MVQAIKKLTLCFLHKGVFLLLTRFFKLPMISPSLVALLLTALSRLRPSQWTFLLQVSFSIMQWDQASVHNEQDPDDVPSRQKASSDRRRVHFPEGDSIILGCLEPFHPTPDNCTSDELIAAYIASCKLYKAPAIDFLLEQLRGIDLSICNERYSRLCLRGIRLTRFQVETLEEVFRRVYFQEVDLEDTYLDEASATALFDMMLHYETCVELSISLNLEKSGPSVAWPRCITYLRKSSALQRFKLSHTALCVNNFVGLNLSGLSLQCLTFRDCSLTGAVLLALVRLLRYLITYTGHGGGAATSNGRCPRLIYRGPMVSAPWGLSLHLPENRLNVFDAETLLLLVRHQLVLLPGPPTPAGEEVPVNKPTGGSGFLEELDLAQNNLRDDGVQVLCSGLLQAYRMQQHRLEVAVSAIAQATNRQETGSMPPACALPTVRGLERLCLADNSLTALAARHLAVVLRQSTERMSPLIGGLTYLDLSNNPGIGSSGVEELCEGLIRNATLRELHLRNVRIGFGGIFALSGYLGETKSLTYLDIRQNAVDISGVMALAKTMGVNRTLVTLLLDARNSSLQPTEKDCELMRGFLRELDDCLRRNRNLQYNATKNPTPVEEDKPSPNIYSVFVEEPLSPPLASMSEELTNSEDVDIKEILLDRPKPMLLVEAATDKDLEELSASLNEESSEILRHPDGGIQYAAVAEGGDVGELTVFPASQQSQFTDPPNAFLERRGDMSVAPTNEAVEEADQVVDGMVSLALGNEPPMEFEAFLQTSTNPMPEAPPLRGNSSSEDLLDEAMQKYRLNEGVDTESHDHTADLVVDSHQTFTECTASATAASLKVFPPDTSDSSADNESEDSLFEDTSPQQPDQRVPASDFKGSLTWVNEIPQRTEPECKEAHLTSEQEFNSGAAEGAGKAHTSERWSDGEWEIQGGGGGGVSWSPGQSPRLNARDGGMLSTAQEQSTTQQTGQCDFAASSGKASADPTATGHDRTAVVGNAIERCSPESNDWTVSRVLGSVPPNVSADPIGWRSEIADDSLSCVTHSVGHPSSYSKSREIDTLGWDESLDDSKLSNSSHVNVAELETSKTLSVNPLEHLSWGDEVASFEPRRVDDSVNTKLTVDVFGAQQVNVEPSLQLNEEPELAGGGHSTLITEPVRSQGPTEMPIIHSLDGSNTRSSPSSWLKEVAFRTEGTMLQFPQEPVGNEDQQPPVHLLADYVQVSKKDEPENSGSIFDVAPLEELGSEVPRGVEFSLETTKTHESPLFQSIDKSTASVSPINPATTSAASVDESFRQSHPSGESGKESAQAVAPPTGEFWSDVEFSKSSEHLVAIANLTHSTAPSECESGHNRTQSMEVDKLADLPSARVDRLPDEVPESDSTEGSLGVLGKPLDWANSEELADINFDLSLMSRAEDVVNEDFQQNRLSWEGISQPGDEVAGLVADNLVLARPSPPLESSVEGGESLVADLDPVTSIHRPSAECLNLPSYHVDVECAQKSEADGSLDQLGEPLDWANSEELADINFDLNPMSRTEDVVNQDFQRSKLSWEGISQPGEKVAVKPSVTDVDRSAGLVADNLVLARPSPPLESSVEGGESLDPVTSIHRPSTECLSPPSYHVDVECAQESETPEGSGILDTALGDAGQSCRNPQRKFIMEENQKGGDCGNLTDTQISSVPRIQVADSEDPVSYSRGTNWFSMLRVVGCR
uniref:Leucine-rich repeat-containing protein 34 n=2 Tax=Mesocestoides corti TaxID=53468 RepID=A0A5K3FA67_MESCO